jgi:hypothetical protein
VYCYTKVIKYISCCVFFVGIPTLQIPQNSYSDTYGNQVTIPCSITSATPSATIVYWTRNQNNNIININNGDSGYQGSTPGSPSLTINFATTLLLKLWCYLRDNMTNPKLLLKLWGYLRVNMTNLKLSLKLLCYLRVNMTNVQLLLKLWCYLRVNMTNLKLLLKLWSYLRVNDNLRLVMLTLR